ncbi:MAG: hypothetical protein JXB34_13885 [Bacteroidales bacterium]|nr:hypothetical protein [Bacteroidales bacterium]
MKKLSGSILLALLVFPILAQTDTSSVGRDSLIVVNTFVYDLNYGISMFHRFCPNQKTYDKQKKILREIIYSKPDSGNKVSIEKFVYYFYNNENLASEEFYRPDGVFDHLVKYTYDANNNLTAKSILTMSAGKKNFVGDTIYKYSNNQLIQITARNNKKKTVSNISITYSPESEIHTLKHKNTLNNQPTEVISEKKFENGKISEIIQINKYNKGIADTLRVKYNYNENGQLKEKIYYKNSAFETRLQFDYFASGDIKSIGETDEKGKKTAFTAFERKNIIHSFGGVESQIKLFD